MDQKYIVAIELSGTQAKGAVAIVPDKSQNARTMPVVETIVAEDNRDCVQYGRIQNLINATNYTKNVVRRIKSEPALAGGKLCGSYVGLAGRSLCSEKTSTEIELATEMEITPEIVKRLFAEASRTVSLNKKVVKVLPRKFYVDNHAENDPVGSIGRRLRGDFTLVTCQAANQRNLDLVIKDRCEIPVTEYIVTPLALATMVLSEEEKQLGCLLADVGAQTTTISIYKDRSLQYLVTLPMGSDNITKDIAMGLNITVEKAEVTKCALGNAMPDPSRPADENARANSYVAARAYEIVANIVANIEYANYRASDLPGGIILSGRGARLKNFVNLLKMHSNMNVRMAELPGNIQFALNTNNVHPSDFLSLISIINFVARRPNIVYSVDFGKEPEPVADTQQIDLQSTPSADKVTKDNIFDNDDDEVVLIDDDPVTDEHPADDEKVEVFIEEKPVKNSKKNDDKEKKTKKKKSIIKYLQDQVTKLMSEDPMEDDAQL